MNQFAQVWLFNVVQQINGAIWCKHFMRWQHMYTVISQKYIHVFILHKDKKKEKKTVFLFFSCLFY